MRLFVAILLDDATRAELANAQQRLRRTCREPVKWVEATQLHLTVKFLGEVAEDQIPRIMEALIRTAASRRPFLMQIHGVGCFPPRGAARVVWAGIQEDTGALAELAREVETVLEPLGFAREDRPLSPHVTLGRVREDRSRGSLRQIAIQTTFAAQNMNVERLHLMASTLGPGGPRYRLVGEAALGAETQHTQ